MTKILKAGYNDVYNVISYILYRHLQLFDSERQRTYVSDVDTHFLISTRKYYKFSKTLYKTISMPASSTDNFILLIRILWKQNALL
jgi:ABC-type enterochelin transport system permease subunit